MLQFRRHSIFHKGLFLLARPVFIVRTPAGVSILSTRFVQQSAVHCNSSDRNIFSLV